MVLHGNREPFGPRAFKTDDFNPYL